MNLPTLPNKQPVEKPVEGDGSVLELVGKPFLTIQGEGPHSGKPAVFVRLAGCDLCCPMCDTDYTTDRKEWSLPDILTAVNALDKPLAYTPDHRRYDYLGLVVITGGEPFRQPIGPLVKELAYAGHTVQIECNGTLFRDDLPYSYGWLDVVISPKTGKVHDGFTEKYARTFYKYPVRAGEVDQTDGLPHFALGGLCRPARPPASYSREIYVTPVDEGDPVKNLENAKAAAESALKFGYVYQQQIHKGVGLP